MCKTICNHKSMKAAGLLGLRLALAFIFVYAGYGKLFAGHEMASGMFSAKLGLPGSATAYLIGLLEVVGGLMILFGVYAKYAATWLAIIMVVAMATVHRGGPANGYFVPLAVLGGCLALMGVGAGSWRLVKTECHCKMCKEGMKEGGCCGGSGGGSCANKESCSCGQADCPSCGKK